jgi:hypothetical protein
VYAFSFSIDQPSLHVTTYRGNSDTYRVVVRNPNETAITIKAYAQDWEYTESGAKRFMAKGTSPYSCAAWITMEKPTVTIDPKSSREVSFRLTTPRDATGGHTAVVFFETELPSSANVLSYGMRLGAIVYQETKDLTKTELVVYEKGVSLDGKEAKLFIKVRNDGNAWNSVGGEFSAMTEEGVVQKKKLDTYNLLPGQKTMIKQTLPRVKDAVYTYVIEDAKKNLQTGEMR